MEKSENTQENFSPYLSDCDSCGDSGDGNIGNCSGCLNIIAASSGYLTNKLETDPYFKDLFDYANELGFTMCLGKWLVYENGNLIGFMGLRTNENYSKAISLISFERGLVDSVLINFTTDISGTFLIKIFNRNGGMILNNQSILDSWGEFKWMEYIYNYNGNIGYIDIYKYLIKNFITYSEYFAKFMCFRYLEILEFISDWTVVSDVILGENEFLSEVNNINMLNYAYSMGYTQFITASKVEYQNGACNLMGTFNNINNQSMFYSGMNETAVLLNFTLTSENHTLMSVFINETNGATFNMSDLTIIDIWGPEHHSCDYWRCYDGCLTEWLLSPLGIACLAVCGIICEACIDTILSPEPYSKLICWGGCIGCIGLCGGVPAVVCAIACGLDACSHGHVCVPGSVRNKHCADYSNGYYHTLVWEECNDIGMVWVTHYTYCGSGYYCDPNTLVCKAVGGGGGGGCPILSIFNGSDYLEEGLLDIHNPESFDLITIHEIYAEPNAIENRFLLKLTEHPKTISHIDRVQLYGLLSDNLLVPLPLISAIHCELGDVTQILRYSDDLRVVELGADHNEGQSESINLKFLAFSYLNFKELIFVIEGYNVLVK
ncbi:MAG: hypothetical protein P8Y97_21775 [Candidatus Lokiarchaeota archaeon]